MVFHGVSPYIVELQKGYCMKRLGISLYPEKMNKDEMYAYIERAAKAGFSRIFSCLLSVDDTREAIARDYCELNTFAHKHGFEVILDCNPRVFNELGVSYRDLSFFHEIHADGIRLDAGFSGLEESLMTFNPYGLLIEINMSNNVHYLDTIMDYMPDTEHLIGCHNFYPHDYSGLPVDMFEACTQRFVQRGIRTAAFVTSQAPNTFANWPVTCGLPTLELHRHLPLYLQVEHLIALGGIDDVIISNCYPTQDELNALSTLPHNMVAFHAELADNLPEVETSIVFDELHFNRGDASESLIRSTQSRVKYKGHTFELTSPKELIEPGDIIIESSLYGHYAGELQIAKRPMRNSGMSSVVGHIRPEEVFLLDLIKPWQKFKLLPA